MSTSNSFLVNGVTLTLGYPMGQLGTMLVDVVGMAATGRGAYISDRVLHVLIVGLVWCWLAYMVMGEGTMIDDEERYAVKGDDR